MQDPSLERSFRGHKDVITGLSFKPSMTQLASASMDHSVMVWNFKPQLRAFRFVGHKGVVTDVDFAPTGKILASSSRDKTVRLWTPNVKGDVTVFKAHTSTVRTVQFSKDSETLLTASDDKTVKLWSTHRTKFLYTLAGHLNWVRSARFSPDSRLIVSGSDDKTVKLWDLSSKSCVKTYWDHSGMVSTVAFHPSGTVIASASTDKSIKLFDIRTHKLIHHYGDAHSTPSADNPASHSGGVNSIAFGGPSGEWMISTGMDGLVKIWDLKEGHLLYTLYGHKNGPTSSAVFSPNGDYFATGGSDSLVMVWKSNLESLVKSGGLVGHAEEEPVLHDHKHAHDLYPEPALFPQQDTRSRSVSPKLHSASGGLTRNIGQAATPAVLFPNKNPDIVSIGGPLFGEPDVDGEETPLVPPKAKEAFREQQKVSPTRSIPTQNEAQEQPTLYTAPQEVRSLPDSLSRTLQQMVRQMDMLTQTMSIIENRLTMNEDRVTDIGKKLDDFITLYKPSSDHTPAELVNNKKEEKNE